jgi:hypothetical protein
MVDVHLQETLRRRIESFAHAHVLERAGRTCDLVVSCWLREGGSSFVESNSCADRRPGPHVADLLDDVARASGVAVALYTGEHLVASSKPGPTGEGLPATLSAEILGSCLVRREAFSGSVELGGRSLLVVAKPVILQGQGGAIVVCGLSASDSMGALPGLSAIEEDILSLAGQIQTERRRALADLLKIIRTIARRIHLLALNASILSAQAGEQGRGFSVVAREIGDLAERTRHSTQELEREFAGGPPGPSMQATELPLRREIVEDAEGS